MILQRVIAGSFDDRSVLLVDQNGNRLDFDKEYHQDWWGMTPKRYVFGISADEPPEIIYKHVQSMITKAMEEGYNQFAFYKAKGRAVVRAFITASSNEEAVAQAENLSQESAIRLYSRVLIRDLEEFMA